MPSKTEINFQRLAATTERAVSKNPVPNDDDREVLKKHVAVMKRLVEAMEEAARPATRVSRTDICQAAYHGDLELVQSLLASGTDVNSKDYLARTPLIAATQGSKLKVVTYLTGEKGVALNATDKFKRTALHYAAAQGDTAIVQQLLEDKHRIMVDMADIDGLTALHCAEYAHQTRVASLLTRAGASLNAVDNYGYSVANLKNLTGYEFRASLPLDAITPAIVLDPQGERVSPEALAQYKRKVSMIEGLLDQDKMAQRVHASHGASAVQLEQNRTLTPAQRREESAVRAKTDATVQRGMREELFAGRTAEGSGSGSGGGSGANGTGKGRKPLVYSSPSSSGLRSRTGFDADEGMLALQTARKQQNVITSELSEMANAIKRQNLDIQGALQHDVKLLQESEEITDQNLSRMEEEGQRLDTHIKTTRTTTCGVYLMLLAVALTWLVAYLFIRVFGKK